MSGLFEIYSKLGQTTGRLRSTDRSAALSFSAPWVYTAMDQSTQRAKPSFNSNSVMFPFCNDHTQIFQISKESSETLKRQGVDIAEHPRALCETL